MSESTQTGGIANMRLLQLLPQARAQSQQTKRSLVIELATLAQCTTDLIAERSVEEFSLPFFTYTTLNEQSPDFHLISFTECSQKNIIPIFYQKKPYFVVTDPWDDDLLQWLANKTGTYPSLGWSNDADIIATLERVQHRIKASSELPSQVSSSQLSENSRATHRISIETIEGSNSPIVRFVDSAIYDAWKAGASDIHFECDRQGIKVKLRLDGVLVMTSELADQTKAEEVISRIKVLAQLDISERRIPQDGRFRAELGQRELDFRVSVMPSIFGEDAVIRLLDKSQLRGDAKEISLVSLGLDEDAITRIRRLARKPHGMLLVTGPTGSGKTTTLYAAMAEIQTGQEKIITIEDPVEYELAGVLQIPVNEKKGLTFSAGLRSILRHDPDKILVGEIRDSETAEIAVQAALTGHLVFTTVHANSVFDVISRFVHMEVDLYSLISALNGIVAQRLIRRNCPVCSEPELISTELTKRFQKVEIDLKTVTLRRGKGCDHCRQTGYKGRHAIAEVLPIDDALRTLILKRSDVSEIKQYALSIGIRPIGVRAVDLVAAGATTIEEIDRVVAYD